MYNFVDVLSDRRTWLQNNNIILFNYYITNVAKGIFVSNTYMDIKSETNNYYYLLIFLCYNVTVNGTNLDITQLTSSQIFFIILQRAGYYLDHLIETEQQTIHVGCNRS